MDKAFVNSETNAHFFFDLLSQDPGFSDSSLDGAHSEEMNGGPGGAAAKATAEKDSKIQGREVIAAAFNKLTHHYPKITEHFQKMGLDLASILGPDGKVKADFIAAAKRRLMGEESSAKEKSLDFLAAQFLIAEQSGVSNKDPVFLEKWEAFSKLPEADRKTQVKTFLAQGENSAKLVRWALRFSELSLLPFKDQVGILKEWGIGEATAKSALAPLWQDRGLPKVVSQAALLRGLDLETEAKALGDEAAKAKLGEARLLFRAAAELDVENPLARRRLAVYLVREGKLSSAGFHIGIAIQNETEIRYIMEHIAGLQKQDARLYAPAADPYTFTAELLTQAKRYNDAGLVYAEAAKAAHGRGDAAANAAFVEKQLAAEESAKPFEILFTDKNNPVTARFYQALRSQGVPSSLMEGALSVDHKISSKEVLGYLDHHWNDDRVQKALKGLGFPVLPWNVPGAKLAYEDEAFRKLDFSGKMVAWHLYDIAELQKKEPVDWKEVARHHRLASYYDPENPVRSAELGEASLRAKDYPQAAAAFEEAFSDGGGKDFALKSKAGTAYFGAGDYEKSRAAYSVFLEKNPKDPQGLALRHEASKALLDSVDEAKDPKKYKELSASIGADYAMLLTVKPEDEKAKLKEIEKHLELLHDNKGEAAKTVARLAGLKDPEAAGGITKRDVIASVEGLAQNYFQLAEQSFADPKDVEAVRSTLNGMAGETFGILARFAKADSDPEIQKMTAVYESYQLIAEGKLDEAMVKLESVKKIPEAARVLAKIENGRLRLYNEAALQVWEVYNKDLEATEVDEAKGWVSGIGSSPAQVKTKYELENSLTAAVREKIETGEANTLKEALTLISTSGADNLKERAKFYLTPSAGNAIGDVVDLVADYPPTMERGQRILNKAWDLEKKGRGLNAALGLYGLVHGVAVEDFMKERAQKGLDALQGNASFGRSFEKFLSMSNSGNLAVDIGLMFVAAGLGNLTKLRMLAKLEKAGVTGYKGLIIAGGVGLGVEVTALWGANTFKEAMFTDPSKVFTASHLAKSYGATLIMIGGLKGFGKIGQNLGPKAAKSLKLTVESGAQLSKGGKALVWGFGHGFGMAGMVATSHVNQGFGLTPKPVGGWKEGLVHDVLGYVQFAIAHQAADRVFRGKMQEVSMRQHTEIAYRESVLLAKGHADAMGFKPESLKVQVDEEGKIQVDGKPLEGFDAETKSLIETQLVKGKDGKVQEQTISIDGGSRRLLVTLITDAGLNRPGFSGMTLRKLVQGKKFAEANAYLQKYSVPLQLGKAGEVIAMGAQPGSPHALLGIVSEGGKVQSLTDAQVKDLTPEPSAPPKSKASPPPLPKRKVKAGKKEAAPPAPAVTEDSPMIAARKALPKSDSAPDSVVAPLPVPGAKPRPVPPPLPKRPTGEILALPAAPRLPSEIAWAERFASQGEEAFAGKETMFREGRNALTELVKADPRFGDPAFREAVEKGFNAALEALKPVLEKIPVGEDRTTLGQALFKHVMQGKLGVADARELAAGVEAGHYRVEVTPGLSYRYVPLYHGAEVPPGASVLIGKTEKGFHAIHGEGLVHSEVPGGVNVNFEFRQQNGKTTAIFEGRAGEAIVQIYDPKTDAFRALKMGERAEIQDGDVVIIAGATHVFRAAESVAKETKLRAELLEERDALFHIRGEASLLERGSYEWKQKALSVRRRIDTLEKGRLASQARNADGSSAIEGELLTLATGETPFAPLARKALKGEFSPAEYREAHTKIGSELVEGHRGALEEVEQYLNGLYADELIEYRLSHELRDEKGEKMENPHVRIKDPADVAPKIARRGWTALEPMTDYAGARIVVKNTNDALVIAADIEKNLKVRDAFNAQGQQEMDILGQEYVGGKETMSVTLKLDKDHPDRVLVGSSSGYRAMHIVVEIEGKPVEIQIQTESIFKWGKIQHALIYKSKGLPKETLKQVNEYCQDVAQYLTDLEVGLAKAKRPAQPTLNADLPAKLKAEVEGDLSRMSHLMDHYTKIAEDDSQHKTQIKPRGEIEPGAPEPILDDAATKRYRISPPPLPPKRAKTPSDSGEPGPDKGGVPERRGASGGAKLPDLSSVSDAKSSPQAHKPSVLHFRSGQVMAMPAEAKVAILGTKPGASLRLKGEDVAAEHAEITRDSQGRFWLRPLHGNSVKVSKDGRWIDLKTDGKAEGHELVTGDKVRLGKMEFTWQSSPLLERTGAQEKETVRPPARPAPTPTEAQTEQAYQRHADKAQGMGVKLTDLLEVSDAILAGNAADWAPSFLNVSIPDTGHLPVAGQWKHLSRAEFSEAKAKGELQDAAPLSYTLHVEGAQRRIDIEARLRAEFGPLLTKDKNGDGFILRSALGQAQVKIGFQLKDPTIFQPTEARALYAEFARDFLPLMKQWFHQEGSLEGGYAFRLLQMIGPSSDGKSGVRFGEGFEAAVKRYETAKDPVEKARAGESLATLCAYLLDAPIKISEYQLLSEVALWRDNRALFEALTEARKQGGALAKEAEAAHEALFKLRSLSDDLRHQGDDLRGRVRPENRRDGEKTYDAYQQTRARINEVLGGIKALSKKLEDAGLKRKGPPPLPKSDKKDIQGASDTTSQDLRSFDAPTLEGLRELGVANVEKLTDPMGPEYVQTLVNGMDRLLKQPANHPNHEILVNRLINGLREWERSSGTRLEWLGEYLQSFRRDRFGVPLDTPSAVTAPPERLFLSREDQARLGVVEINPSNVLQVVEAIRGKAPALDKIGGFSPFRLEPANESLLLRILENYGPYIHHKSPELGTYLHALFEARPVYASDMERGAKEAPLSDPNDGRIPERRGEALASKQEASTGDPLGFHYVEEISTNGLLGRELHALAHPKPSLSKVIPGLTPELEMKFERGARVEKWPNGQTLLVDVHSGGNSVVLNPATPAEILAYRRWRESRGFSPIPQAKGQQAWHSLETRAKELGVSLYEGADSTQGPLRGKALAEFIQQNGAQIAQVNELFQLLPATFFNGGRIKRIFLKSPRPEGKNFNDAHFSAYDAANGSLYLYSGAFNGSRRNLAGLFLHEAGHGNAARYRLNAEGDSQIPIAVRHDVALAHQVIAEKKALFALDWAGGKAERLQMQTKSAEEFLADVQLAYVAAGPELRSHIRSLPEGSAERRAWDYLYAELSDRVFGGLEYDYNRASKPPPNPDQRPTLKMIRGGKDAKDSGPAPTRIEVPENYLQNAEGPQQAIESINWGGISAGRHPGIGYKARNEDRYSIGSFTLPDGSHVVRSFVVDGMGGHGKGEFAGVFIRYVVEKASSHPKVSLEDAIRMADRQLVEHPVHRQQIEQFGKDKAPGAVIVGMETRDKGQGEFEVKFANAGDSEAFLMGADFKVDPHAYTTQEFGTNRKLPRGMTLFLRANPMRHAVDQALGGHLQEGQAELRVDISTHSAKKGQIAVAGSDGLFENFIGKDEMSQLLKASGAKTADQMQKVLLNEALIRMSILDRFEKEGRYGQAITHEDFTRAFQEIWGAAAPAGVWRYEGMILKKGGLVIDPKVDPLHDKAKGIRGSFKKDNVTVLVQILGERVTSKAKSDAFIPQVLPPGLRFELPEPSPLLRRLMDLQPR